MKAQIPWLSLAVFAGVLASTALALAALCGRLIPYLDIFTHVAPLYAAGCVGGLVSAAWVKPPLRQLIAAVGCVGLVACAVLIGPELLALGPKRPLPARGETLKVIQFNSWGREFNRPRERDWLLKQDADVIVLQESKGLSDDLIRRGYHLSCGNCYAAIFTKAAPLWSNTPGNWRIHPPPVSIATIPGAGGPITIMGVHRSWPTRPPVYRGQMADLARAAAGFPKRFLIIAGDFNSTPWSFARRDEDLELGLERRTRALFTWPAARADHVRISSPLPVLPIDHVYAGAGWLTADVSRGPNLGSDHYPVVVTLIRERPDRTQPIVGTLGQEDRR